MIVKFSYLSSKFLVITVFTYAFLLWSPVITNFIPLSVSHFVVIQALILIAFLIIENRYFKEETVIISLLSILGSLLAGIYWGGEIKIILFSLIFVSSFIMVSLLKQEELHSIINLSSIFVIILLIGAWIAFIYTLLGGRPVFEVIRVDGKPIHLFLTTFTNSWNPQLNSIRAAGIYDEPGAFAFVICTVAALRHISLKDKKTTWIILFLGLVTLSLAYLIYVTFHFLAERKNKKYFYHLIITFLIILFLTTAISFIPNNNYIKKSFSIINLVLLSRFEELSNSQKIIEQNVRLASFISTIKYINKETLLWGADKESFLDARKAKEKYPEIRLSTPFGPLFRRGLLVSWPYYLMTVFFLIMSFKNRNFVLFGFLLLLFQRPFLMSFGYSLLCLLPFIYYKYYRFRFYKYKQA